MASYEYVSDNTQMVSSVVGVMVSLSCISCSYSLAIGLTAVEHPLGECTFGIVLS